MPTAPWAVREKLDRADSETRRTLLDAARTVFEARGYARTTVADITREAGVGRATFYVYFASKEEAFAVLAHQVRDRFLAAQELTGTDADNPWAVARATNAAYLDAYAAHLAFLTLIDHQAIADPAMYDLREEIHARPRARTARYIARLVAQGRADPAADPEAVATAAGGMVSVFAPLLVREPGRRDELVARISDMYLRLLGLPGSEPGGAA
ncbi:TetR/AcrR family transcriptional regulator [Streptomyces sp. HMX87]|uniref:TetR/AcrR family transcriptional regulator n=1 Tax=Streptomyces sp. HMX87 TaxID=3390849 RepID=UPI003A8919B5